MAAEGNDMEPTLYFIGFDGEKVVNTTTTREQIATVTALECGLVSDGNAITWAEIYDEAEPRSLFSFLLRDRKMRVDDGQIMADRPPIAVLTGVARRVVRLEFYEGHDALELTYDVCAPELEGQDLPRWMEKDPQAYDPAAYLKSLGFPDKVNQIVTDLHKPKN